MLFPYGIFAYAVFLFIETILYLLPGWMPSTVPFGVRIPPEFAGDPVLVRLRHQYRKWVVVLGLAMGLLLVLAPRLLPSPGGATFLSSFLPLLWLIVGYAVYYATRRQLLAIKTKQRWYEGQRAAAVAEIPESAETDQPGSGNLWPWILPMIIIAAVTLLLTLWRYPHLPAVLPIHFGPGGQPDAYARKSLTVALNPFFAQLGLLVIIGLTMAFANRMHTPLDPAFPRTSSVQQRVFRRRIVIVAGVMGITTALSMLTAELLVLNALSLPIGAWGIVLFPLLGLAVTIVIAARTGQLGSRVQVGTAEQPTGVVARDDDRFWKGGVFYYNPEDPAFWVPKRFGVGWTINFAHPGSWVVIAVFLLAVLSPVAVHLF
ncbi:MAG: DUF1648 domain-containing protein [Bacilli bacterium]